MIGRPRSATDGCSSAAADVYERTAMNTSMDGDFDTGNVRYKARERYSFGVSDPLGIYGSPGA